MKIKFLFFIGLGIFTIPAFAQVGINTGNPTATLDVAGVPAITTTVDGIIPPRIAGAQLRAKTGYAAQQNGAIVYVTAADPAPSGQTVDVTAAGLYYFDSAANKWKALSGGGSSGNDTTDDAWINNPANARVELGTTSAGAPRAVGTEIVTTDNGRIGIGTATPQSTLAAKGSFEGAYTEVSGATYTITDRDYQLSYTGATAGTMTLPAIGSGATSFTGRNYVIYNLSPNSLTLNASGANLLRYSTASAGVASLVIGPGGVAQIVNNAQSGSSDAAWDVSIRQQNTLQVYGTQLKIPPHANANGGYADWTSWNSSRSIWDTPATSTDGGWHVQSKSSTSYTQSATISRPSRMTLVYEYEGPAFEHPELMLPVVTVGNGSSWPDIFVVSFAKLYNANYGSLKTYLVVNVARVDQVGDLGGGNISDWSGTFFLNVLLVRPF